MKENEFLNTPLPAILGNDAKPWHLDDYINNKKGKNGGTDEEKSVNAFDKHARFQSLCNAVKKYFDDEWEEELKQGQSGKKKEELLAERHKKAIIGYPTEVNYFKSKIIEYLKANNLTDEPCPKWYESLVDAIFHENWGLAGIAKWMSIKDSSSAKIIGDKIYYFIMGRPVLQEQRISPERFEKLRKALMLKTPKKRLDEKYTEVFMHSGERIAIYYGDLVFEKQPAMVFRKYIVSNLSLEEQAERGTIPKESINMQKAMVACGFNSAFVGPVRAGKSTYLTTMQFYEDRRLEGIAIQTDPEIPFHKFFPDAPIIQLIADGEDLKEISKKVLRSDCEYIIMAEARDGYAFNCVVEMADKGTIRCKTTLHLRKIENFCYNIANKIQQAYGGNIEYHICKVADSYHYIFELMSLPKDRSKKRLKGIYEIRFSADSNRVEFHQICRYDHKKDTWTFRYDIGSDKIQLGNEENYEACKIFQNELKRLAEMYPMEGSNIIIPFYSGLGSLLREV